MKALHILLAAGLIGSAITAHAAKLEIAGNVTQTADIRNSTVVAGALGPGSTAQADINRIEGSVQVGGNATQTATLLNSQIVAIALGRFHFSRLAVIAAFAALAGCTVNPISQASGADASPRRAAPPHAPHNRPRDTRSQIDLHLLRMRRHQPQVARQVPSLRGLEHA